MPGSHAYAMLAETLVGTFGVPSHTVRPEATLQALGLDSLVMVELALVVEEQTGVRVTGLAPDSTLADVAELIEAETGPSEPEREAGTEARR